VKTGLKYLKEVKLLPKRRVLTGLKVINNKNE